MTKGYEKLPRIYRCRLKQWVYAQRDGTLAEISKSKKPLTGIEFELSRLKKELAETKSMLSNNK